MFLLMVIVIPGVVSFSWGDEVYFVNGDRISGTIVRMEEASLLVQTTHSGEIRIAWSKVKGFSSTTPLIIELADGSQYKGPVNFSEADGFQMVEPKEVIEAKTQEKTKEFFLDAIAAINPMPWFRYNANAFLGGNRTAGNSETQAINASTEATMRFGGHRVGLGGQV